MRDLQSLSESFNDFISEHLDALMNESDPIKRQELFKLNAETHSLTVLNNSISKSQQSSLLVSVY